VGGILWHPIQLNQRLKSSNAALIKLLWSAKPNFLKDAKKASCSRLSVIFFVP
jgi:hypothetical protein